MLYIYVVNRIELLYEGSIHQTWECFTSGASALGSGVSVSIYMYLGTPYGSYEGTGELTQNIQVNAIYIIEWK